MFVAFSYLKYKSPCYNHEVRDGENKLTENHKIFYIYFFQIIWLSFSFLVLLLNIIVVWLKSIQSKQKNDISDSETFVILLF